MNDRRNDRPRSDHPYRTPIVVIALMSAAFYAGKHDLVGQFMGDDPVATSSRQTVPSQYPESTPEPTPTDEASADDEESPDESAEPTPTESQTPSAPAVRHVIAVSIDGLGSNAIRALKPEQIPNLTRLAREGAGTLNARSDYSITKTLPNHTGMVTGRLEAGAEGHNVDENQDTDQTIHQFAGEYVPSIFDVVHDNGGATGLYTPKEKFNVIDQSYDQTHGASDKTGPEDDGKDKIDSFELVERDAVVKTYLGDLGRRDDGLSFDLVHIANPDLKGHEVGYLSAGYYQEVRTADRMLGQIMAAVEADPERKAETVMIVTADHGGHNPGNKPADAKAHSAFQAPANYTIPFYVWGAGVSQGADLYELNADTRDDPGTKRVDPSADPETQPIYNANVANLAAKELGLKAVQGSTVDSNLDLVVSR